MDRKAGAGFDCLPGDPVASSREVMSGWLTAEKSHYRYPIVNGVPRTLVDLRLQDPASVNASFTRPDSGLSGEYKETIEHFRTQ